MLRRNQGWDPHHFLACLNPQIVYFGEDMRSPELKEEEEMEPAEAIHSPASNGPVGGGRSSASLLCKPRPCGLVPTTIASWAQETYCGTSALADQTGPPDT